MIYRGSLAVVCLLTACTLGCQDVTRSESDLPGAYVLEAIDNHLLPVQVGGLARNPVSTCRITGGTLTLDATGRFTLRDALGDCPSTTYISLAGMYAGGLVPDPNENVSQTGTYTSTDKSLALHFDDSFLQGSFFLMEPEPKNVTAPYSPEAIALDPIRYYGDTIARRRVYIRYRGPVADAGTN